MIKRLLGRYDAFLLDIDGVLVRDAEPIDGAAEGLSILCGLGSVVLLTNNSTRTRVQHADRLTRAGFAVRPEMVLSSSYLTARYVRSKHGRLTVFVVGEDGLREELRAAGHRVTEEPDADAVIVGMDRDLTYAELRAGLIALESGARLIATNNDATFPTPGGRLPGAGAMVGAFRGMGFEPETVVGKPSPVAYEMALDHLGAPSERVMMIGDRLETDILGGRNAGLDTALVLSGISTRDDIARQGIHPTWIAGDLADIARGNAEAEAPS